MFRRFVFFCLSLSCVSLSENIAADTDDNNYYENGAQLAVTEQVGLTYRNEPVSWDLSFQKPRSIESIGLVEQASQVEILEGTPEAVMRCRLWTIVSVAATEQRIFTLTDQVNTDFSWQAPVIVAAGKHLQSLQNDQIAVAVPAQPFADESKLAHDVLGPVAAIRRHDSDKWIGQGYLDHLLRVTDMQISLESGPVFVRASVTYHFEQSRTYEAQVRLFAHRDFVDIDESFNLGNPGRFIFNLNDWPATKFLRTRDGGFDLPRDIATAKNPAHDFIRQPGQTCLARLVVWSQFGYFGGKQENIGVIDDRDEWCVGAFLRRPDRWTRVKTNHIDLYKRPQIDRQPLTRGLVGQSESKDRVAFEAWLIDGRRQWAMYVKPARDVAAEARAVQKLQERNAKRLASMEKKGKHSAEQLAAEKEKMQHAEQDLAARQYIHPTSLRTLHTRHGIWSLDRLNRQTLIWNPDGSRAAIEHQTLDEGIGGAPWRVVAGTGFRDGLAYFNGSNSWMRSRHGTDKFYAWAQENPEPDLQDPNVRHRMATMALFGLQMIDESAYPGYRAMLPWTDPEALNPFYQGMENQNFNADRYRLVSFIGQGLAALNHPRGEELLQHGAQQMSQALDRYVYPESGAWEESHTYAAHTIKNLQPLADALAASGVVNFYNDPRFAAMHRYWLQTMSPETTNFGRRVPVPVGDHGVEAKKFDKYFKHAQPLFAKATDPLCRVVAKEMAWYLQENELVELVEGGDDNQQEPAMGSRWYQGFGSVLRRNVASGAEQMLVVRAGQSWGHHHQDKGSLWFWGRNVAFFGDAAWGSPPGGTYGNPYKQGPAGGTQIQIQGVSNWPLPAKYAAPWVADDEYHQDYDYVAARCVMPFNPRLELTESTPIARFNGYDRQVIHLDDLLIVRDTVEATTDAVWRLHSYQFEGTTVDENSATLRSPEGVVGQLHIVYPLTGIDIDQQRQTQLGNEPNQPFGRAPGEYPHKRHKGKKNPKMIQQTYDDRSLMLEWQMPRNAPATWVFGVHAEQEQAPQTSVLDPHGRVTQTTLADGRVVTVFLNRESFQYEDDQFDFVGQVGLVISDEGKTDVFPIRSDSLRIK